ncbi:MAG TPA: alpha-amylase, partial [Puia sp.]|nr:alpha-amylase [Puia sp.]
GKNLSRDPERTPMQWDDSTNAGFSRGEPWLRIDRSFIRRNVQAQRGDNHSPLVLYKKLITLRQRELSLNTGAYRPVFSDHQMIAYIRQAEDQPAFLVVLNLTHRPCYFTPPMRFTGVIVIDTLPEQEQVPVKDKIELFGDEGMVVKLDDVHRMS